MTAFASAPVDTPTLSPLQPYPCLQYLAQHNRRQGRLRARSHPQGDDDLLPRVRRRLIVFTFVSMPIDTSQHLCLLTRARSLEHNNLGPKGVAALAEGLKGNSTLQVLK